MKNSTLYPPNSQHLSDNIIGKVMVRSGIRHHDQVISTHFAHGRHEVGTGSSNYLGPTKNELTKLDKRRPTPTPPSGYSSQPRGALVAMDGKIPARKFTPELMKGLIQLEAKHRAQRRAACQRYHKKIRDHAYRLEHDTKRLKKKIRHRESQHEVLLFRTPTD
ncbi:hypothetical protein GQ600_13911 [Phytophthora cactorum]|nr:hypothetical protein GQ600_13911 [Phytophthora cactorum]